MNAGVAENKDNNVVMILQENELTEMISVNIICRLCANQSDKLIGIYSEDGISNDLANKMNLYLPVKVTETDDLPLQCCWQCASTVLAWHDLVVTSVEADRRLRSYQFFNGKQLQQIDYDGTNDITSSEQVNGTLLKTENRPESDQEESIHDNELLHVTSDEETDKQQTRSDELQHKNDNDNIETKRPDDPCEESKTKLSEKQIEYQKAADLESKLCNLCNVSFEMKFLVKKHMKDVHNLKAPKHRRKKSDIDAPFLCLICNKGFTRKFDLQKHILKQHPNNTFHLEQKKSENKEIIKRCKINSSDKGQSFFKCDVCQQVFKKSYNLVRHRTIHTAERPNVCHICGKSFRVSNALKRHINEHHYGIRKFSCEECGKRFANKTAYIEHANIHTNNRPFVCDVCGKRFKQNATLRVHKLFHSDRFRFECNVCDKKYHRKQDLKIHNWKHTGERPRKCRICSMTFRLGRDLKRHMTMHAECACAECGSRFVDQRYLKMHMKIHLKKQ